MKKPNRKEEIKNAVLTILEKDGIGGIKTARIAKIIGFSEAALYKHFSGKNEILAYVLDERLKITKDNKHYVDQQSGDPISSVRLFFYKQLKFMDTQPGLYRIIYSDELHLSSTKLMSKLRENANEHYITILNYIQKAVSSGLIKNINAEQLTMILMGCVHSAFSARFVLGKDTDITETGMEMIDLILKELRNQ